jgi:uncharacterized lipoprotein YddW (UPF0748 family)
MNTFRLFKDLNIALSGSSFAPQTQELLWSTQAMTVKDFLPVGSRLLAIDPSPESVVLANWGDVYPAIVKTKKGAFLNWDWGLELGSKTNVSVLAFLMSPQADQAMAEVQNAAQTKVATTPPATGPPANGDPNAPPAEEAPKMDFGLYFKKMRDLDDYKRFVYNNIESALQLSDSVDVQKAEQLLYQSDEHKAKFESLYLAGNLGEGDMEHEKAKSLLLKALVLASPSSKVEGRAIWLDRGSIVASGNPEGLRALMKKLDEAGINIVYFETVNAGFPIYPSKLLPQNPLVTDWDPLKVAVEEGHKRGMEVHAWVWCFAVGNKKHNDVIYKNGDYPGPILAEKGLITDALRMANTGLVPPRQTEFWLSPASPKARGFLKALYSEIVTNYDVDGLQLDYIRYPFQHSGTYMGYEAVGRERFEAETGLSLGALSDSTMKTWVAWKSHQVNTFVKEVSETLKGIRPTLKLSAAVFPMPRANRLMAIQQDWETWVNNGWIDTLSPMSYTSSPDELQKTIERLASSSDKQIIIYPGIAIHKMDSVELLNMVQAARRKGSMGSTIFAMAHLDDLKQTSLGQGPYKQKKPLPPHRDPLHAVSLLLNDYQAEFSKLANGRALDVLTPENVQSIQKTFTALNKMLAVLEEQAKAGRLSQASATEVAEAIKVEAQSLADKTQQWLELEKTAHPFRVYHFTSSLTRINNLLGYALERLDTYSNTATARVMPR